MTRDRTILGIDVGSVSVALAELSPSGVVKHTAYAFHRGDIRRTLEQLLADLDLTQVGWVASTGGAPDCLQGTQRIDGHLAHIAAAQHAYSRIGTILVLGGERFSLIRFDGQGNYLGSRSNSSCAAGTGSFLDQHASTLGLADAAELAALAREAGDLVPPIASRCAVFAKTDLIHAQQQGYARDAICNGLCDGLAAIVADTVLSGEPLHEPVVLSGGVALNGAVRAHLSRRLGCELWVDHQPHIHAAAGAALSLRNRLPQQTSAQRGRCYSGAWPQGAVAGAGHRSAAGAAAQRPVAAPARRRRARDLVAAQTSARESFYEPLGAPSGDYPDFDSHRHYLFVAQRVGAGGQVEVDDYRPPPSGATVDAVVGIDIGSTSTKAVLLDEQRRVLVGVYARTAGQPLVAVQTLFAALADWAERCSVQLRIVAAGTTGAGRKFIGAVVGADLIVDEITAHACAAHELSPEVDTIIEIGGQDSKFTTLRQGRVTSAAMNTVCAAGTGSFIEEQARRLDCPLSAYAEVVTGARAPLASDRCTVFMQRDVTHLLHAGYTVPEVLATVLHSVRENYLQKVAREASIGERVCFQGATAKNGALVAAFEQRLGRPIMVSRYCHLTGALGVALSLVQQPVAGTAFRGLGLATERIDVATERCELCRNHCAITSALVWGQQVAYGFRCGRDLETDRYVSANRAGFDLCRARAALVRQLTAAQPPPPRSSPVTMGLPAGLQLFEQLPFWRRFFAELGVPVVTSETLRCPVSLGKQLTRAELCAPMTAFQAHVASLAKRADFVFAPVQLEAARPDRRVRRQYCYYSQWASPLLESLPDRAVARRCLRPVIAEADRGFPTVAQLYAVLRPALGPAVTRTRVAAALHRAAKFEASMQAQLRQQMAREMAAEQDLAVVLLGRPYSCLAPQMNKGIPDIIAALGIKAFFQDMLDWQPQDVAEIRDLLQTVQWHYAAQVLSAACVVAKTPGLYPVVVTSFKCAPDSCVLEYVRRVFDRRDKPYLVLELDEHDSALGYETRIEAAIRAFRNHHAQARGTFPRRGGARARLVPVASGGSWADKTLFLPSWDKLVCPLLVANLNRAGVRAALLRDGPLTTRKSMRLNTGQCTPMSIIAQGFIEAVEEKGLDPGTAVLWTLRSQMSCNLGMFSASLQAMLEAHGRGFERAQVYQGEISMADISVRAAVDTYFAYLLGGHLRRMACRVRPYEVLGGATDRALASSLAQLREAFLGRRSKLAVVQEVVDRFAAIDRVPERRPKVAVFGDLYTRDNAEQNQDLVRFIERHGGEVVTTPYSDYLKLVARSYFRKWLRERKVLDVVVSQSLLTTVRVLERRFQEQFERLLGPLPPAELRRPLEEVLAPFGVTRRHTGESFDNLLKIAFLLQSEPDISLFVQANPAFCCPSLVTEAMARRIEDVTGVPVVTVTYDGTDAPKNDVLVPYLAHAPGPGVNRPGRRAPLRRASG